MYYFCNYYDYHVYHMERDMWIFNVYIYCFVDFTNDMGIDMKECKDNQKPFKFRSINEYGVILFM